MATGSAADLLRRVFSCCRKVQTELKEAKMDPQAFMDLLDAVTKEDYYSALRQLVVHWQEYDSHDQDGRSRLDRAIDSIATKLAEK